MDWDNANDWAKKANKEKQIREIEPRWSWDCGLKLDYDGGLLRVSSRFYQDSNDIFSGSVSFLINDKTLFSREFTGRCLDVLQNDVEGYVFYVTDNFEKLCKSNISVFINANELY